MQAEHSADECKARYEELKRLLATVSRVAREAASRSSGESVGANGSKGRGGSQENGSKAASGEPQLMLRGFLDIRTVASVFAVHPKTIETWIRTAGFPCLRLGGVRRFDYDDVTRWASARKEG